MDNDAKFTLAWRAAIVLAILLSLAAAGVKFTLGAVSIGPVSLGAKIDDQRTESEQRNRERAMEERVIKIETYLYKNVAPIVEAQKAQKEK